MLKSGLKTLDIDDDDDDVYLIYIFDALFFVLKMWKTFY